MLEVKTESACVDKNDANEYSPGRLELWYTTLGFDTRRDRHFPFSVRPAHSSQKPRAHQRRNRKGTTVQPTSQLTPCVSEQPACATSTSAEGGVPEYVCPRPTQHNRAVDWVSPPKERIAASSAPSHGPSHRHGRGQSLGQRMCSRIGSNACLRNGSVDDDR